jgi:hypothetical protein
VIVVLGAPGSGKSELVPHLSELLHGHVVVDWDAFMGPASELAGRPVQTSPATWPAYARLVRAVVDTLVSRNVVVLTVCTPDELCGWPIDRWLLLDCDDVTRQRRLAPRGSDDDIERAVDDGRRYRELGLTTVDSTNLGPERAARARASLVESALP